jgi:hypothetical protein
MSQMLLFPSMVDCCCIVFISCCCCSCVVVVVVLLSSLYKQRHYYVVVPKLNFTKIAVYQRNQVLLLPDSSGELPYSVQHMRIPAV